MDDLVGTQFAAYRIERLIGSGGMSTVYLAEHTHLGRKVALKVVASHLTSNETFRQRLLRESRVVARLDHPHVIPVYDAGEVGSVVFLAMRFVEGADLGTILERDGRLDPMRACAIVSQVADALDSAHQIGLVHRDVKPGNVLISSGSGSLPADHSYLCDFGITKIDDIGSRLTGTGQIVGTTAYLAPEQIEGESIGPATDVYGLGCVAFEMLTGRLPFERDTNVALMWAHLADPPPIPTAANADLPAAVDEVLVRALAKSPPDRHESAGALASELRGALQPRRQQASSPAGGGTAAETVMAPVFPADAMAAGSPPAEAPPSQAPQPPPSAPPPGRTSGGGHAGGQGRKRRRALAGAGVAVVALTLLSILLLRGDGDSDDEASGSGERTTTTAPQRRTTTTQAPSTTTTVAVDEVLQNAVPGGILPTCTPQAPAEGATSMMSCTATGVELEYRRFPDAQTLMNFTSSREIAAGSPPEQFCEEDTLAGRHHYHLYGVPADAGRLLCYRQGPVVVWEWSEFDNNVHVVARRPDGNQAAVHDAFHMDEFGPRVSPIAPPRERTE